MQSIIIFASGAGTNAAAIIEYFQKSQMARVAMIVSNKAEAGVLEIAKKEEIPFLIIDRKTFCETLLMEQMKDCNPSLIVLAGFLWKIPVTLLDAFKDRIINIHPALLPAYGGRGMYGANVHHAVLGSGDLESGITIHYVNERYDEGNIILQARCKVEEQDQPQSLAARIHKLEHFYYPRVIEFLLEQQSNSN